MTFYNVPTLNIYDRESKINNFNIKNKYLN
jgi:hypothetical protein